jgi:hypothetical protein
MKSIWKCIDYIPSKMKQNDILWHGIFKVFLSKLMNSKTLQKTNDKLITDVTNVIHVM